MHDTRSFYPIYLKSTQTSGATTAGTLANGVTVAASNGVAVASTVFPGTTDNNFCQIRISNKTSVWVHVNFGVLVGGQTVTAATLSSYPIAPGGIEIVSVDKEVNAASVFADGAPASSTSVMFHRGEGI